MLTSAIVARMKKTIVHEAVVKVITRTDPVNWERWGTKCEQCNGDPDPYHYWCIYVDDMNGEFENYCEPFCSEQCAIEYLKEICDGGKNAHP